MTINPAYIPFEEWQRQRLIRLSFKKFGAALTEVSKAFADFGKTCQKATDAILSTQMRTWE